MGINRILKRNIMRKEIKTLMKKEKISSGEIRKGLGKLSLSERHKTLFKKG